MKKSRKPGEHKQLWKKEAKLLKRKDNMQKQEDKEPGSREAKHF